MQLIDTHAHLDASDYRDDRAAVIGRAFGSQVGIVTVGTDGRSSRTAIRLAQRHHGIWASVGVHPHEANTVDSRSLRNLENLARQARVVAIGEIGLDYYRDLSPRKEQRSAFRQQLALARSLDLPVIVHNRDSTDDLFDILAGVSRTHRGVIHSFLGDAALARRFLNLGLHLGVGGPVTFERNDALRDAVRDIPLERLLLETDAPYLTPVPHRGRRNEPAYVRHVAESIAQVKRIPVDQVAQRTTENAVRLFTL